jgi:release factor glutamine methyltransferase
MRQPLRLAIIEAERILADAGVPSPRVDAELIAVTRVEDIPLRQLAGRWGGV